MRFCLGKKGIIFTLIAIVIASFFSIMFASNLETPADYQISLVEMRVGLINDYAESFFSYSEGIASMSGYFALQCVITNMSNLKQYENDFENHFRNVFLTGNITPGTPCAEIKNKTISDYLDYLVSISNSSIKIKSNYAINSVNISQETDPFQMDITINLTLNISDKFANATDTRMITSQITIIGLKDPLFLLNGVYNQTIKKGIVKTEGTWNYTDLEYLYNNHAYKPSASGVSFINRIKGNFSPSKTGIESFVNQSTIPGSLSTNLSMVDYLFFNRTYFNCSEEKLELVRISSALLTSIGLTDPLGLQIDESHRLIFNITSSNAYVTSWCPS